MVRAYVAEHPGANTRSVADAVGLDDSTASYHLRRLAKEGKLVAEAGARERRWFEARRGWCPVLRRALPELRRPEALAVAMALGNTPANANGIARASGVPVGQVRWIATRLEGALIVERSRAGWLSLRQDADVCLEKAARAEPCDQWGRCPIAQEWARRMAPTPQLLAR